MSNGEWQGGSYQNKPTQVWENQRKCYVYYLPNLKQGQEFLEDFAHIVLTYSQDLQKQWKTYTPEWTNEENVNWKNATQNLSIQKELKQKYDFKYAQQKYINVYTSTVENELIKSRSDNDKRFIKKLATIQIFTNDFVGDINFANMFLFTLDMPLDIKKFQSGKQQVFKNDAIVNTVDGIKELYDGVKKEGILEIDTPTELTVTDISTWEQEGQYIEIGLKNQTTYAPIKNLTIEMSKYAEIYSIEVEGERDGNPTQAIVSVKNQNLMPTLTNIVDDQGKLTKYYPWLDLAMNFKTAFKFIKDFGKISSFVSDAKMQDFVLDLMLFVYAKKANYNFVALIDKDAGADVGKLLGSQRLTTLAIPVARIANVEVEKIINESIDYFHLKNVVVPSSVEWQELRQFLAAISQLVPGKMSVAGGKNNFHELYLPWTLRQLNSPVPAIKKNVPNPNLEEAKIRKTLWSWVLEAHLQTFQLKSEWFELNKQTGTISLKSTYNLSNVKSFQSTHHVTLPVPADLHQALEKINLPEKVEFDKDLQFLAFHFIDPLKLEEYFDSKTKFDNHTTTVLKTAIHNSGFVPGLTTKPTGVELAKLLGINDLVSGNVQEKWVEHDSYTFEDFSYDSEIVQVGLPGFGGTNAIAFKPYFKGTTVRLVRQELPLNQQTSFIKYISILKRRYDIYWFLSEKWSNKSKPNYIDETKEWRRLWNLYDFSAEITRILKQLETSNPNFRITRIHYPSGPHNPLATTIYYIEHKTYYFAKGYEYNVLENWKTVSEPLKREAIFDRVNKIIKLEPLLPISPNLIKPEQLPLELTFKFPLQVKKIVIRRDWGNKTVVNLNGFKHITRDWNTQNELVAVDKYIYL